MANKPLKQTSSEKASILAQVPVDAKRIQVLTRDGKRKYKARDEIGDTDVLVVDDKGKPIFMMMAPGRPPARAMTPVVVPSPSTAANPKTPTQTADIIGKIRSKAALMSTDALVRTVREKPDDMAVLYSVLGALGEETASLRFEREEAEREGLSTAGLSVKRVHALSALANTWLKHKDQLLVREVDLKSPGFQAVARLMMETFKEAMLDTGMRVEMVEAVFAKASMAMAKSDWESEAKSRMKNSA